MVQKVGPDRQSDLTMWCFYPVGNHDMFHDMFVFVYWSELGRVQGTFRPKSRYVFTICFHDMFLRYVSRYSTNGQLGMFSRYVFRTCFTICLFISPDLDGHRAPKMKYCPLRYLFKVSKPKYEATALHSHPSIGYPNSTNGYTPYDSTPFRFHDI